MTNPYDELVGGDGRRVFFRPRRYRTRHLVGDLATKIRIGELSGHVHDLSLTGASFFAPGAGESLRPGEVLPVIIHVAGEPAVDGQAEVVRHDLVNGRTKWAVRFLDTLARPNAIEQIREEIHFKAALRQGTAVFEGVPRQYRSVCQDAALVLRYWKTVLDRAVTHDSGRIRFGEGEVGLSQAEADVLDRMRAEWNEIRERAGKALPAVYEEPSVWKSAKRFTELVVTPLTLEAPIWRRAYEKPLGYPGDFELMNFMYDNSPRGDTAFGRVMHQLGREERLAATVNSRKELLVSWIQYHATRRASERASCVRLLSIGSGPSREIEEFIWKNDIDLDLEVSLVDQDEDALGFAYERVMHAAVDRKARVEVRCRHISFRDLFGRPELVADLGAQDLAFSAGLFDYLSEGPARALADKLFEVVDRGGSLLIGNAADDATVKWVPEFILDWQMRYRDRVKLCDLASAIAGHSRLETINDASGAWHFLHLRK